MKNSQRSQRGSVIVGIVIGVVLGLAVALAVAVYVTKVPIPFLNRGQNRSAEQDAAESRKNRDWDRTRRCMARTRPSRCPRHPRSCSRRRRHR